MFCVVGGTGVLVDMGVLFLLADPQMLGWTLSISKALAAEIALVSNFVWNDLWTFRDISTNQSGWRARARRFLKFNLICLAGIALSVLFLKTQMRFFKMNVYVANFIAIVLVSLWNFGLNLKFGWNKLPS
jgi:dolichol-phosphate mannosyltransferase